MNNTKGRGRVSDADEFLALLSSLSSSKNERKEGIEDRNEAEEEKC
jgi:hypothetical protein